VRKVLVGGKQEPRASTGQTKYLEGAESPDRDYYKKYSDVGPYTPYTGQKKFYVHNGEFCVGSWGSDCYQIKIKVSEEQIGIVQKTWDKVRFGIMFFNKYGSKFEDGGNKNDDGGYISDWISGPGENMNLVTSVQNKDPSTWTPLAESLYEAIRFFKAIDSAYQNRNYAAHDPIQHWCQKNFVIILTDGESTKDKNIPGGCWGNPVTDPNGFNVQGWMDKIASNEGYSSQKCTEANSRDGTYYLEGVAYYAHTNDLRTDLQSTQNLTTYTVFAFDESPVGKDLLQKTAKYGGFIDKNDNDIPDLQNEWDQNGDNMPDNYYEAQNGYELENALLQAIADILKRASSGTAVSVLSTSTRGSGCLAQAYFLPSLTGENNEELSWIGELKGLWVDPYGQIREDTDSSHDASGTNVKAQLELDKDKVLKFYNDGTKTVGHIYSSDKYGNVEFPCSPDETKGLANFAVIWNAGKKLWETNADNRSIYTSTDGSSLIDFKDSDASTLKAYLRACDDTDARNIINYVRGEDVDICLDSDNGTCSSTTCTKGHRDRALTISGTQHVWKLGDIVYSTPRILSHFALNTYNIRYNDTTYADFIKERVYDPTAANPIKRNDYLFVGANDGMLHCFYLGKIKEASPDTDHPGLKAILEDPEDKKPGKELWVYIPMNALPYVKYLAYPDYCHIYYVDQRAMLIDASIDGSASTTKTKDSWRTILIGEMRFGGSPNPPTDAPTVGGKKVGYSSIFALDITDPEAPSLLWEFSDPDLNFTTSYPAIVRVGPADENGHWYVILGSGPTDYDGDIPPNKGYLYVIDLKTGNLVGKLEVGNNTYVGDCIAVDPDNDYNVDAIYCGTVKKQGNNLTGSILRILTNKETPIKNASGFITNWKVTTLCDTDAPITAAPELAFDEKGNLWCFFGTGKFFGQSDKTDENPQYIYGVKDTSWGYNNGNWGYTTSGSKVTNIKDVTDITVSADIEDYICMCEGGQVDYCSDDQPAKRQDTNGNLTCGCGEMVVTAVKNLTVSNCDGNTTWDACVNYIADNYDGWKRALDTNAPTERNISKPAVIGQLAMFTTFKPNSDVCGFGGDSYLYSLYYKAGIPYKQPSILLDTAFQNNQIKARVHIGQGAPAIGESITTKQVGSKTKTYVQLSTGQVVELTQQPVFLPNKRQFWIEQ
ncbi:MAG: hypothetical protein J7M03_01550, partial [Candidatus Desulfofervidaceae bacterium]|nr:hypothetical protein [Candidatus Desulfofervidaceae bacterium]